MKSLWGRIAATEPAADKLLDIVVFIRCVRACHSGPSLPIRSEHRHASNDVGAHSRRASSSNCAGVVTLAACGERAGSRTGTEDDRDARGWERSCDSGGRFLAAIGRQGESSPNGDVVVCSGDRALTSLLVSPAIVTPEQAFAYWHTIGMPDLAALDLPASGTPAVVRHFAASV